MRLRPLMFLLRIWELGIFMGCFWQIKILPGARTDCIFNVNALD